jgi:hypothetical protein
MDILIHIDYWNPRHVPLLIVMVDLECREALAGNHLIQAAMPRFAVEDGEGTHVFPIE